MSEAVDHYEIQLTITATVYVKDGVVTGIEAESGWGEPYVEAYSDDGPAREVRDESLYTHWENTELGKVLSALTGKWEVNQK